MKYTDCVYLYANSHMFSEDWCHSTPEVIPSDRLEGLSSLSALWFEWTYHLQSLTLAFWWTTVFMARHCHTTYRMSFSQLLK